MTTFETVGAETPVRRAIAASVGLAPVVVKVMDPLFRNYFVMPVSDAQDGAVKRLADIVPILAVIRRHPVSSMT
ncbi:hypothetical protein SCMU_04870 [Sinomonas cyclohexanicum]|uniref:Uncharacterized protein n=1 Tax=Sinomonas cyclohexanicum TaxID=322009 RepID=A0ABM7PRF9_SINCY|nr:hypothetical protein SCMU_04870 [Corynebacterium cyclohexanicum]